MFSVVSVTPVAEAASVVSAEADVSETAAEAEAFVFAAAFPAVETVVALLTFSEAFD